MQPDFPNTPRPKTGGTPLITEFFKPIHHSEPTRKAKRGLEDEIDSRPAKKLRSARHSGIPSVDIDRPKTRKPASARLLDDSNAGLRDSLVYRCNFFEEKTLDDEVEPRSNDIEPEAITADAEDTTRRRRSKAPSPRPKKAPTHTRLFNDTDAGLADRLVGRHFVKDEEDVIDRKVASPKLELTESPLAVRLRNLHNTRKPKKRPSSARLLDDVDGGLMDGFAGRFETARYEERIEEDKEVNGDGNPGRDASTNQTPTNSTLIGAALVGDTKDNIKPTNKYTTPSRPAPTTPKHYGHKGSSPNEKPSASDSPSTLLLPSPVMDLPAPSSPLSFSSSPVAWPSPPSSQ
ncbi:hypothetical protein NEUTE1DRAFT_137136 [Neurospora tetrasperma FGSC 2508]|uniref:Uncharacterized protein n=1 Tax=Neurospora tetrasperma (strain FGSC 2508 / ATCC MYA-4615 / P0657) TaxID=510951 RepID=F8MJP4_NEUT8|nr:uncharacterized protein NEUTE1DRAFT_137136 [Neurospora tetrasperma FGSC 2508]EGO57285.1 hypothetical protein NEUTE1DRAFT_137136 [Neurospora tetrasperma FGSC 2508]EGZ72463.1 hypothetical protein NEUTE2DRAFT_167347 [Neurospora tetrasperma FGSC 2509]